MSFCSRCDRYFVSDRALEQHTENSSAHHICYSCNKDFASRHALIQHWVQSPRHDYCQRCDEHFDDEDELEEHYDDEHFRCRSCGKVEQPPLLFKSVTDIAYPTVFCQRLRASRTLSPGTSLLCSLRPHVWKPSEP